MLIRINTPVTTAAKPERAPAATPAVDSTYIVVVEVPAPHQLL